MEHLESGNYVIGYFGGIEKVGGYDQLTIWPNSGVEGFAERMNIRQFNRDTGERVVPDTIEVGDKVAVRVFQTAKTYRKKDEHGQPYGDLLTFIAKDALSVQVV